ncbi:hypothetical protein LCGC14_2318950 [marine sediment metagenome]|uniref:Uncharacterized protein n=1 Tax=marine sediment metagenome TaxID=412755 RepID=A0A0F9EVU6_9ZZZZ
MISKRTLEKWRKEALIIRETAHKHPGSVEPREVTMAQRIITMTQILIDQHLLVK